MTRLFWWFAALSFVAWIVLGMYYAYRHDQLRAELRRCDCAEATR